jgi:predicted transcriptional regulator YdeE
MALEISNPKIEHREAIHYIALRKKVSIGLFGDFIDEALGQCDAYFEKINIKPTAAALIRYHECPTIPDEENEVDVSIGYPVPSPLEASIPFISETIPEGKYASLVFVGVENGIAGNDFLIQWAKANDIEWDSWQTKLGDGFTGRVEHLLDGPAEDPDPANWRTEVAIKIKDLKNLK